MKKIVSNRTRTPQLQPASQVWTAAVLLYLHKNPKLKKLKKLDNVKISNLIKKNRDHKKVLKQDEDAGNLQILLYLRSLFWLLSVV